MRYYIVVFIVHYSFKIEEDDDDDCEKILEIRISSVLLIAFLFLVRIKHPYYILPFGYVNAIIIITTIDPGGDIETYRLSFSRFSFSTIEIGITDHRCTKVLLW
jgi:hypothetical protein